MLVISRKANEDIIIGQLGDIKISVLKIVKNRVHLGVAAPKSLPVHRAEIFKKFQMHTEEGVSSC